MSLASLPPNMEWFQPVNAGSLSVTAADRIVEAVATGRLQPGQRLVEQEIANRLAISRVPLREAMKTLCAQGILEAEPHRGTRVAPIDDVWAASVRRSRLALERLAFRDAAPVLRKQPHRARELVDHIAEMERNAGRKDWLPMLKADLEFHRGVVAIGGDAILTILWETLARHVLIVVGLEAWPEWSKLHHAEEHRSLLAALMAAGTDELDRTVERHVMLMPRTMEGRPA
jgi:DNA-binding GntR family transcriptional regulator